MWHAPESELLNYLQKIDRNRGAKKIRELVRRGFLKLEVTKKGEEALRNRPVCPGCKHLPHIDKCGAMIDQDEYCDCKGPWVTE